MGYLEGIMLNKINQAKTNTVQFYSYVEFKKENKCTKEEKKRVKKDS